MKYKVSTRRLLQMCTHCDDKILFGHRRRAERRVELKRDAPGAPRRAFTVQSDCKNLSNEHHHRKLVEPNLAVWILMEVAVRRDENQLAQLKLELN